MKGPRDALVTGMGFCLPGAGGSTVQTRDEFWDTISTGALHLGHDGVYFGGIGDLSGELAEIYPALTASRQRNLSPVHHYGLIATANACRDAGLAPGDFTDAAVLTARASSDSWFSLFDEVITRADRLIATPGDQLDLAEARSIFTKLTMSGGTTDVAFVVASMLGAGGPTHVVSSGCASGAIALGDVQRLIASNVLDMAVVVGADFYDLPRMAHYEDQLWGKATAAMRAMGVDISASSMLHQQMRPYDRRAAGSNMANGAATLVVESREHAERRNRPAYTRIVAQSNRRDASASAMSSDIDGRGAIRSARICLESAGVDAERIGYVNGGSEGDALYNDIESKILTDLFGDRARGFPVSVQEGSFGHSGAPLGQMGVAATGLMMATGQVCPTAACEEPGDCVFDPLPGTHTRTLDIEYALSFNYHLGGGASTILLEREDAIVPPAPRTP